MQHLFIMLKDMDYWMALKSLCQCRSVLESKVRQTSHDPIDWGTCKQSMHIKETHEWMTFFLAAGVGVQM